jgi:hypothetical protein
MDRSNKIFWFLITIILFLLIYSGFFYNIYIHPSVVSENYNSLDKGGIILFGDLKYIFEILDCHHKGFDVYQNNSCVLDKGIRYGSFLYSPIFLYLPEIPNKILNILILILSTFLISIYTFILTKIINPKKFLDYLILLVILFNPISLFIIEKLNIDIIIFISLFFLVYYSKNTFSNFFLILLPAFIKFYPSIFIIKFLIEKKISILQIIKFLFLLFFLLVFFYLIFEEIQIIFSVIDNVSRSFKYAFSLNTLSKILSFLFDFKNQFLFKILLILLNLTFATIMYFLFLNNYFKNKDVDCFSKDCQFFILSSLLSVTLYLVFSNNFYREVYLIGIIPMLYKFNLIYKSNFARFLFMIYIYKNIFLLIFFPYYYNSILENNIIAQVLIGIKSILDFCIIGMVISLLILLSQKIIISNLKKNTT